jgi:hypothetical protein
MTIRIKGVATIPDIYKSEGGVDVAFRAQDALKLSQEYIVGSKPMVVNHDDKSFSNEKGTLLKLSTNDIGELEYVATITDDVVEAQLLKLAEEGKIPNVSPQLVPKCDSIEKLTLDDGSEVYYADEWEIDHLSIVNKGRCDDTLGCGVHEIEFLETGETVMTDEIEAIKLELTELKAQHEAMVAEKADVELKLTEVTTERDAYVKQEMDETKALILTFNKEAKFDDKVTLDGLKIVLGALEENAKGQAKVTDDGDGDKSATTLKLEELKKKRADMFKI